MDGLGALVCTTRGKGRIIWIDRECERSAVRPEPRFFSGTGSLGPDRGQLSQCSDRALAARAEHCSSAIPLPQLRSSTRLVRKHPRRILAVPSWALQLMPGANLVALSSGRADYRGPILGIPLPLWMDLGIGDRVDSGHLVDTAHLH